MGNQACHDYLGYIPHTRRLPLRGRLRGHGRPHDPPFDHATGRGWVAPQAYNILPVWLAESLAREVVPVPAPTGEFDKNGIGAPAELDDRLGA